MRRLRIFAKEVLGALAILGFSAISTNAAWTTRLESEYVGNGVFEYDLFMEVGGIVSEMYYLSFGVAFPGGASNLNASAGWIADTNAAVAASWYMGDPFSRDLPLPNPIRGVFSGVSPHDAYRLDDQFMIFSLRFNVCPTNISVIRTAVGYIKMQSIVPALPGEGDGSLPFHRDALTIYPDATLSEISSNSLTVARSWDSTLLIEASTNMYDWVEIDRLFGSPPEVTWTSPVPLKDLGKYFRAQVISPCHDPGLLMPNGAPRPRQTSFVAPPQSLPEVLNLRFLGDMIVVTCRTVPGQVYRAFQEKGDGGVLGDPRTFTADSASTVFHLPRFDVDQPVLIRVLPSDD